MNPTPLSLIAEVTHRCPLRCVYCSNPIELEKRESELETADWLRVIREAQALGVLQLHFTGGEPLLRGDLEEMISEASRLRIYTNLITSGVGLGETRLKALVAAGLDHVQLSVQDSSESGAERIAGVGVHAAKLRAAALIAQEPVAFTVNAVIHKMNIERLGEIIALAESMGAQRLEVAHTQYYGWALVNRAHLLPTRTQFEASREVVARARARLGSRMKIDFVVPDYHLDYPKPCMGGWAQKMLLVEPSGRALPCHAAGQITGFARESVRESSLEKIWNESALFQAYRGLDWMPEPCRSCDRRDVDFGGCRCQAFALTGDAARTDPVCHLSPDHALVRAALEQTSSAQLKYRGDLLSDSKQERKF